MPSCKFDSVGTDESVVISGISGRFPQTDNMQEFARNLYAKHDMVDDKETRWKHTMQDVPRRTGKVNNLDKFDAEFFSIGRRERDTMDPQHRMLIEHSYEAVLDAGINPETIRGTRTGVFCGICFSETEVRMYYRSCPDKGLGVTGCAKSLSANRISYALDLKGPSYAVDTACSSSMYALDVAYRSIRNGECDAAIVTGTNLTLHPFITYQFALLGVLARDGFCRPFDKDANGYSRSEAVCAVFLQKTKDAKRIYSHLVHSKANCDGFKSEGITYPSGAVQRQLLEEFYQEVGISPTEVDYVEAHSTGTFVGDPEECDAIDKIYCTGRDKPLPVGSVKCSIGHSEASAGVCSIAKCIIAMENGLIPPNINFTECRPTIPSLVEGRLKVVSETLPLEGPLVAINSFGFGGANAHALFCRNLKEKENFGVPKDDLSRLVVWSGRTKEAIDVMLQDISTRPLDAEFIALLHNIQRQPTNGHRYRGFGIFRKNGENPAIMQQMCIERVKLEPLPLVVIFGGINSLWRQDLDILRQFAQVEATVAKCNAILRTLKFDLSKKPSSKESVLFRMVGTTVLQIAIVDLLKSIGVEFDMYGGHSVGQFTCAYIDRCLNLDQVIKLAFWHGLVYAESKTICDHTGFVQLNYKLKQLPLRNLVKDDADSFGIISGSQQNVIEEVRQLKSSGYFAEEMSFMSLRSETPTDVSLANKLRLTVNSILSRIILPTPKWITAKISQTSSIFHSPKIHDKTSIINLLERIPKHTHIMELANRSACEQVLSAMNRKSNYLPVMSASTNAVDRLLSSIGYLHTTSQNLQIAKLYPDIQFPVSRGTNMISPLIRWDHRELAFLVHYTWEETAKENNLHFKINLSDPNYKYVAGHCIDGRILFPATGYLQLVWELVAYLGHRELCDVSIEFEDVRFLRATTLTKGKSVELIVSLQEASGCFEILEGDTTVVSGIVRLCHDQGRIIDDEISSAVMLKSKDFYKELRLRGYHYTGLFKSVVESKSDGTMAKILWKNNWVAFLDSMLQVGIIAIDSRALMVPTAIEKLSIRPKLHLSMMEKEGDDEFFTMKSCAETKISVCGGIVISNPRASSVGRRNPPGIPVLEAYQFMPYHSDVAISAEEAIRMCVQLALENVPTLSVNVAEIQSQSVPVIVNLFGEAVADLPLVRSQLTLLSSSEMEIENVTVKNEKLSDQGNLLFLITDNHKDPDFLRQAANSLLGNGFIILREALSFKVNEFCSPAEFNVVATFHVEQNECFVLLQRKMKGFNETPAAIQVNLNEFSWLSELKQAAKFRPVVLYSQGDSASGIIGLVNCIRKEPKMQNIRCVFIDDPCAPPFALDDPFYQRQLALDLAINVYRNGSWGSYKHALLNQITRIEPMKLHCYANCRTKGDLSSMMWFTGALNEFDHVPNKVKVSYCSLNFRDVMVATGRLTSDVVSYSRMEEECELGYEYTGVTEDGRRVMGALSSGALSTDVQTDPYMTWAVPDDWTLEQACTIPIVYGTVVTAFKLYANVRAGQSVLIHAGSGGVGLAAINLALGYGLNVFTTVSTEEKKNFLLGLFPSLKSENIGQSRDTSFVNMIKSRTQGRGVDYVLNSLSEEKLQASVRCLAKGGHFLEIGKYDMMKDSHLAMELFKKGITFTSIMLDLLMRDSLELKKHFHGLLQDALNAGLIKPLNTTVFEAIELEKAFRYLASGKHTGKILIRVRQNETDEQTLPMQVVPRMYCNHDHVYILVGGLGGFGLELADWLVMRGCKKLMFSSSRGITKPYQEYRIKIWNGYGVKTQVCTADVTTLDGCHTLLEEAARLGPVAAIYNLAVQLRDSILENQTEEKFIECLAPKAKATEYLDVTSRALCPQLRHFIVFSSVSCGRGNAGQSNYGMANSVMERIIERRKMDGLPAKAIQWGAIGEVGLVADMAEDKIDLEIGGTLQQRISSCLQEMDRLLSCEHPIVASMVVAEKRMGSGSKNIIEAVMNIMSIRELKSISMESTLADIGMDSLMAVEIKQVLERDFDMILSPQELRTLSFAKLLKMDEEKKQKEKDAQSAEARESENGMNMLLRNLGNEATSATTFLRLPSFCDEGRPVLIIPGVEGVAGNVWNSLAAKMNAPVFLLQLTNTMGCDNVPAIVDCVIDELISNVFKNSTEHYTIVAYSFGALVGIEIAKRLQSKGMEGKLLLLDGTPKFLKQLALKQLNGNPKDEEIEKLILLSMFSMAGVSQSTEILFSILELSAFDDQIEKVIEVSKGQTIYSPDYIRKISRALCKRVKMAALMNLDEDQPLDVPVMLVKPTEASVLDIEDDYGLSSYTTGSVTLRLVEGSHITILESPALVEIINHFLCC